MNPELKGETMKKLWLLAIFSLGLVSTSWAYHKPICKTKQSYHHKHYYGHGYSKHRCGYWCQKHKMYQWMKHYGHYAPKHHHRYSYYDDHHHLYKSKKKYGYYPHKKKYKYSKKRYHHHDDHGYFRISFGGHFD